MHDVKILDQLAFEPGALNVMDRGYLDFDRLAKMDEVGCFLLLALNRI